jgi:hypothetical protein
MKSIYFTGSFSSSLIILSISLIKSRLDISNLFVKHLKTDHETGGSVILLIFYPLPIAIGTPWGALNPG